MTDPAGAGGGAGATRRRRVPVALVAAIWALTALGFGVVLRLDALLREAGRPELAFQVTDLPYVLALASAAVVGTVVALRRPRHPVGWLLLALALLVTLAGFADTYARYGFVTRPGALPGAAGVGIYGDTFIFWPVLVGFILLLTPTGAPPSRRWRWWAWVSAAAPPASYLGVLAYERVSYQFYELPNPLYVPALAPLAGLSLLVVLVAMLSVVVGGASLVVRYRRARGAERQQLRWVALAAALAGVAVPCALLGIARDSPLIVGLSVMGYAAVLCAVIGAAILRYRLYDLDRILSRTVSYGLLTVLLGACYGAVVVGLGPLVGQNGSNLVVASATLAVAAAFQPARRRVQDLVDRRFNRRRYDAARTIQAFSQRLRQQVDLDALTAELLTVTDQTMQPTRATLWLRRVDLAGETGRPGTARQPAERR